MKKIYKARPDGSGMVCNDEEAQKIGEEFERLFPTGAIKTEEIIQAAASRNSVLHHYFEWDNNKAAHEFRKQQARHLIRCITVEVEERSVIAYHNVKIEGENHYVDVFSCKESEDLWSQVINAALKEVEGWSRRYQDYQELAPIHHSISKTKEKLINETRSDNANKKRTKTKAAS